ncbi:bifunctional diguanylate cyclase/phosphodiesterase [Thiomicrorhabdus cannonii]|uniref:bifunctional diguanylate cyclase/phosphodiesterase n=1 Tax=Thiomicrorhabdus cannonii TaxID=2748011 RepID=UPI0015B89F1C|nr:GGDEF domain-containing phosphodiesterase [Thiomicrorhabdus cannonii]
MNKASRSAIIATILYTMLASLWILSSDWLVSKLFRDSPDLMVVAQNYKGLFFVLVTSLLLFVIMHKLLSRMDRFINANPAVFYVLKKSASGFKTAYVSDNISKILGYPVQESMKPGWWASHIYHEDKTQALSVFSSVNQKNHLVHEYRFYDTAGDVRYIRDEMLVRRDKKGDVLQITGSWNDVTAEKKQFHELLQIKVIFDATNEGVMITDQECNILNVNRAFTEITGYTFEEIKGRDPSFLKSAKHDTTFYQAMWHQIKNQGYWQGEIYNRRKSGEVYPEILTINLVKDEHELPRFYVATFTDISQLKASQKELEFLSFYDALTHLPNRSFLMSSLQEQIDASQSLNSHFALLIIDLDYFKDINDSYGHSVGDKVLLEFARRLKQLLANKGIIARLGGDEFAVLLNSLNQPQDAGMLANKLLQITRQEWLIGKNRLHVSASIGICLYPDHGLNPEQLVQNADAALYRAKSQGRDSYAYYSKEMTEHARKRIELEARLKAALKNDELKLYYQPQISLTSGKLVGLEVLLRWFSREFGTIPPAEFIPIAEETGLIRQLGQWILEEACIQGKKWLDQGLQIQRIAVNISAQQLHLEDIESQIITVIKKTSFPPELLELEITEGALVETEQPVEKLLVTLKKLGVSIAIDDFGTGYSSLAYLKRFSVDMLKIDKSFIDDIETDNDSRAIIQAIISMAHSLNLQVIAEGVENEQQRQYLEMQGCDFYQGYLSSPALSADEFEKFIHTLSPPGG